MSRLLAATDADALMSAVHALDAGDLVVYPTDTLYALGGDALDDAAIDRVFDAKRRPADMALPVAVADLEEARHIAHVTPLARELAARFLPGPLTLVLRAKPTLPDALLGGRDTVAVRVPANEFARALAAHFGPVTATSANVHRRESPRRVAEARAEIEEHVVLYVDGGELPGTASTMVDATGTTPRIVREGAIPAAMLEVAR
ncbi:MAG: L-threonylcarbamoyladenylate synthase [Thermoplasmatota archaeon]